jgi:hypothetical protein
MIQNSANVVAPAAPPSRRFRRFLLSGLSFFLAGAGFTAWAVMQWPPARALLIGVPDDLAAQTAQTQPSAQPVMPLPPPLVPGAANRAEGIMLLAAVRRALDNGEGLSAIEPALVSYFGSKPPAQLAVVLGAGRQPVTREQLHTELAALAEPLEKGPTGVSLWERVQTFLSTLIVIRSVETPSSHDLGSVQEALRLIDAGRVAAAADQVAALPGASIAKVWLARARLFTASRTALDQLEQIAINKPGESAPASGPVPVPVLVPEVIPTDELEPSAH